MKDKERPNIPHENPIFDSNNSQDIFPSGITKKSDYEFFIETTRPEDTYDKASDYFSIDKVQKYAESKSIMRIQEKITKRVIEIADIPAPAVILDLGIGSGFSTIYMYLRGYRTVGVDITSLFL